MGSPAVALNLFDQAPSGAFERIEGAIDRIRLHNPEDGFFIAVLKTPAGARYTVKGKYPNLFVGERMTATGRWIADPNYGLQFEAETVRTGPPRDLDAIRKYLGSGAVKGVKETLADRLVKVFGGDVLEVLSNPARLTIVPGVSESKARKIAAAWSEQQAGRDAMIFLTGHGLGPARAMRVIRRYGDRTIEAVNEDPYRLARDIRGIGFTIADKIAQSLGVPRDSILRARAGLSHILDEATASGHCGLTRESLLDRAATALELPRPLLEQALEMEALGGHIVRETVDGESCWFLADLHRTEAEIAYRLKTLLGGPLPWRIADVEAAIADAEAARDMVLKDGQRQAMRMVLRSKVSVITGNPGTGKTSMLVAVLTLLARQDVPMALAAPTGKAAKRMSQATGMEATTIHRLLEVTENGFRRNERNPLPIKLLVIDETSMLDVSLMASVLRAMPDDAALILVGDVDQLPSVGPGNVLGDIIDSGPVPVSRLTEIVRQAADSLIITNAHRINQGRPLLLPEQGDVKADFYFVEVEDDETALDRIIQMVKTRIPARFGFDPLRDIQVLAPMKSGRAGTKSLNAALQQAVGQTGGPTVEKFGERFLVGDRIIQTVNNYEKGVFNGDTGWVESINPEDEVLEARYDDRIVRYDFDQLDEIRLAYATTIHKSQGSEFPCVVIPMTTSHYSMLQRNLLYTAVTRGKRLVVLVGQKKAIRVAMNRNDAARRTTRLRSLLSDPTGLDFVP